MSNDDEMAKFRRGRQYDEEGIRELFPRFKLIYEVGDGDEDRTIYLYRVEGENIYIEKAAAGTHGAVCFFLSEVTTPEEAEKWKEDLEVQWKEAYS